MASQTTMGTILILDDDLGFAMWLGRALNDSGFPALPACTSEEVLAMVSEGHFEAIDLVIVNFEVDGSQQLLDTLAVYSRGFKVIGIDGSGARAVEATLQRPMGQTPPSAEQYLQIVRGVLQR